MIVTGAGLPPGVAPPWEELGQAQRLLRRVAVMLDRVAADEGWPVPFSPVRCIVLAHLGNASSFGLTPARLARLMEMRPSSLAHHLDVLEEAELIARSPRGIHDRRKVAVRLTGVGRDALWRLGYALERGVDAPAGVTPPPPYGFSQ